MKKLFKRLLALLLVVIIVAGVLTAPYIKEGYTMYKQAVRNMPIADKVEEIRSSDAYTPFEEISPVFINELLRSEDRRFYQHFAVDPISLVRAVGTNVLHGRLVQGGSTITQQLAKNMYFSFEKKLERKIAEVFVAFQLERMYTKDEILSLYCSLAYFGQNCYGVKHAAGYYYSTEPHLLNQQQSQELVKALKAPSVYNPSTM